MANLADSESKLDWARTRFPTLRDAVGRFVESEPCEFFNEPSQDRTNTDIKLRLKKPIPREVSHIVGDIIHNLRSSLDYAACDLAELNGAKAIESVYFPFGKTSELFEKSAKEKLRKLSPEAKEHIRTLKPYRGGNEKLWLIHYLDLGDKHRRLTPIGMSGSTGAKVDLMTSGGIRFAAPRWKSLRDGMRVATIQSGTEWTGEISAEFSVAFGDIESIASIPVEPLLEALINECEVTLRGIRAAFF